MTDDISVTSENPLFASTNASCLFHTVVSFLFFFNQPNKQMRNWMNHGEKMHLVQPIHLLDNFQVFALNFKQFVHLIVSFLFFIVIYG